MAYDAVKMKDWQISEAAEANMPMPDEWRERLNLQKDEVIPYGRLCKLDFMKIMERLDVLEHTALSSWDRVMKTKYRACCADMF